jgi:hypothetical protein
MVIDPGETFMISVLPEPLLVRERLLDYGLSFTREGEKVVMERRVVVRPGRIPAAAFGEWLDVLKRVDEAENQRIVVEDRGR